MFGRRFGGGASDERSRKRRSPSLGKAATSAWCSIHCRKCTRRASFTKTLSSARPRPILPSPRRGRGASSLSFNAADSPEQGGGRALMLEGDRNHASAVRQHLR